MVNVQERLQASHYPSLGYLDTQGSVK